MDHERWRFDSTSFSETVFAVTSTENQSIRAGSIASVLLKLFLSQVIDYCAVGALCFPFQIFGIVIELPCFPILKQRGVNQVFRRIPFHQIWCSTCVIPTRLYKQVRNVGLLDNIQFGLKCCSKS